MSNPLAEGSWPCTILNASAGEDGDRPGVLKVRINVRFDDGPSKGRTGVYEDEMNARSSIYIIRSMKAVGWKGGASGDDPLTLGDDADKWIKETGGKTTADVRHIEVKRGKKFDKWVDGGRQGPPPIWDKVSAIGRGAKPLTAPKADTLADARDAIRRAMADDGSATAADEGIADVPSDDIPF